MASTQGRCTGDYSLTKEQVEAYHREGFLLIEDFFTPEEHRELVEICADIRNWPDTKNKWMQYYERNTVTGEKQLCRSENFTPFHERMREYVFGRRILGVLAKLNDDMEYVLFKEKINYKLPGGGGFPAHQDAPAFIQFGQVTHTTVMFTIDPTTTENGCLEVVPGSHTLGVLSQEKKDGSINGEWCAQQKWIPVETRPGCVLIFGAYLAHRSGDNRTANPRTAVYLTYNQAKEGNLRDHYYEEKRRLFPPASDRVKGKDYSQGAAIYNIATPITE
ncbi:uncharacterized protein VTP21DRAFT_875 [Calcarisporiella thermophila]|uniref:uncharacterized protein n=1 Tax=Calcarisporiella thermophila TaxID=911321 RepID=UPI0037437F2B